MEATKSEDAPNESSFAEMDPERKRFLEEALKSLTVNVVEQLEQAVKTIGDSTSSEDNILDALEVITDYVQDIDAATDFYKVGGFCILDGCLASPHGSVRSSALRLIRDLAQNNPFCQEKLLDHGILNKLIELLSDSSDQVSCDAMSAISAIVRAYEPGLQAFLEVGGLECMLGCIGDESRIKLQIRVAFLISTITFEHPYLIESFIKLDAVEKLAAQVGQIEMGNVNSETRQENFVSAICALSITDESIQRCRNKELKLQSKLEELVQLLKGKDEYLDIVGNAQVILCRIMVTENKDQADR